ncbi:nitronate monooxygenase family protein [uncultured Sphingomonas sp.]|uniref:NAD(P)H-dependent flavin oxidoreductase n=1 Tax=uncultured Sphingomonas sp. TaxID=158754 RepID=UPI002630CE43|nr:nitronate monooxygenase family protein [uncultured Sphingomonas sp.]
MSDRLEAASGADVLRAWRGRLRAPVIGAPLFLVSNPALVVAQCIAGIIGTLPSLNARPSAQFAEWLVEIAEALAAWDRAHPDRPSAPFGVNLIVHRSNGRLDDDLALCVQHRVPLVISSMGARPDVNAAIQAYGGVTLHDVISQAHARKAIEKGATGLIAVAAGAGGHAGRLSPFALLDEIRVWFDGPVALSGAIGSGNAVAGAIAAGADLAYVGSAFIATEESNASAAHKQGVIDASAEDIVYTPAFSGTPANYLRRSILAAGLDPDDLPTGRRAPEVGGQDKAARTWSDIWGCGQGIGGVAAVEPAAMVIGRLVEDYHTAMRRAGVRATEGVDA